MKSALDLRSHLLAFALLVVVNSNDLDSCRFPQHLQKKSPWVADYKDGPLVAYFKPTLILIRETAEGGTTRTFTRECIQRTPDNKFLVLHKQDGTPLRYVCMQFIQRGEHIIQVKTSDVFVRQSLEICDEREMAIDPYPLIHSGQTQDSSISCPFSGGYNLYAYFPHPNDSLVCNNLILLMRLESECDRGEGITIDFRKEECVPPDLPRNNKQKLYCLAHWTQESYTFIVLQHSERPSMLFCLRTADPLSSIRKAHLWLKVQCDTQEIPAPEKSHKYLRFELTKRIFASTCEDELEMCSEMTHYCNLPYKKHCAHTCRACLTEYQIGECPFEEQYRGRWIESNTQSDTIIDVTAYALDAGQRGRYTCLDLQSDYMKSKRVLLELYNNGCFPRYACVEMEKVTSSVMKFRMGNRITWPIIDSTDQKREICKDENFNIGDEIGARARERPARLLVNTESTKEVDCGLPHRLQNGVAFREDGKHCGGCLNYDPRKSATHFVISPVNCSIDSTENKGYRTLPLQYSCLASFQFYNETYSVVTKTTSYDKGMGQYLVWIFTPENHIKVLKAADTFVFERNNFPSSRLIQAQFTILRNDNLQCRNLVMLQQATTTTTTTSSPRIPWGYPGGGYNNNGYYNNGKYNHNNNNQHGSRTTARGDEYVTYNPNHYQNNGDNGHIDAPADKPKFDNAKGEKISGNDSGARQYQAGVVTIICSILSALVVTCRTHQILTFLLKVT